MALYGTLSTIALPDLLQWVENSRKSGALTLENGSVDRTIVFREGRVVACSSTDPPFRLGQMLLARGLIGEAQLREGLRIQEEQGGNLGALLVEMGAVSSEDVVRHVAVKAEETIFGLFDWDDATFEFHEDAQTPPNLVEIDLAIQDILLRGLQRTDEMRRIREVLDQQGIVLARTEREIPERIRGSRGSARILQLIDGNRTLAELLLHARASEYLVSKFLFELLRGGYVRIAEIRDSGTAPGVPVPAHAAVAQAEAGGGERPAGGGTAGAGAGAGDAQERHDPDTELAVARRLLARAEHEAALAVLHAASRAFPGVPAVKQMISEVEAAFLESVQADFPQDRIPVPIPVEEPDPDHTLSPDEAYLLSILDGRSDIRSILWVAPLRSLDVFRGLQKLRERGLVALRDPS